MDDLGKGLGKSIGGLGCLLPAVSLLLVGALLVTLAMPVLAAREGPAIESIKGKAQRMASTRMAGTLTRFTDPAGDQQLLDGTPVADAPKWSDLSAVTVAAGRMPPKLIEQMATDYPPGADGVFYGTGKTPGPKDRIVFVAVRMAGKLPADSLGQQVEIGFSGDAATPLQAGTELTTWAGTETFTLAGLFSDGLYHVGATDVSGRQPGLELAPDEFYDVATGALGYYQPGNSTWYIVLPRAGDTAAITVSVRSSTAAGSLIDRLDLPGGGHFVDLRDPAAGYRSKSAGQLITCRALETISGGSGMAGAPASGSNLVRYSAGVPGDPKAARVLAAAVQAAGSVSVAATPVRSEAEPLVVDAELSVAAAGDVVRLAFEVPDGQWTFALADGLVLKTPSGEAIVDHSTLTGPAGVTTGPDLDGFVAGDRACLGAGAGAEASADPSSSAGASEAPAETAAATE